ncbi:unnamed protein product [Bursaphelenchus okinawaensis]|uniref:GPI transamidase subunit PIG-U n=1 Tax=Bursaphelenchus okinawaensis TaxID=465554 RepID=A0A811JR43_9BILA|nr:unnamed protein product [Bursaphelenchus okinawaensis]CAG9078391.1 unnamed protein product [Bursaphelenchus okinawaensis]
MTLTRRPKRKSELEDEVFVKPTKTAVKNCVKLNISDVLAPIVFGIFLRLIAFAYFKEYLQDHVGFTAQWNSFRRLKDAIALWDQNGSLYADRFHGVPLLAVIFYPLVPQEYILRVLFISCDVIAAVALYKSAGFVCNEAAEVPEVGKRLLTMYLLNPLTVGVCAAMNTTVILNMALCVAFYFFVNKKLCMATILVCLASQLNIYYLQLLLPIVAARMIAQTKDKFNLALAAKQLGYKLIAFSLLYSINFLIANWNDVIRGNVFFFFTLEDYTPNMGMYWYLFSLIFVQYRLFFLVILHFLAFIHVFPLFKVFWTAPVGLWLIFLQMITLLSSYPTYAEFCLFLPLLTTIKAKQNSSVFFYFLVTLISLACSSSLITLQQWVQTGSGNANFFFGSGIAYLIGQAFLLRHTLKSLVDSLFYNSDFYKADQAPQFRFINIPILKKA